MSRYRIYQDSWNFSGQDLSLWTLDDFVTHPTSTYTTTDLDHNESHYFAVLPTDLIGNYDPINSSALHQLLSPSSR